MRGVEKDDKQIGIFHAFVGSDRGIIKKVSFKRTDLPYQRESRILGAKDSANTNLLFSDHYNADISMIGNPIFKPGMLIFVDPSAMGISRPAKKINQIANSPASQLGIGGYYMITKVDNIVEPPCSISTVSVLPTGAVFTEALTPSIPANNVKS